MDRRSGHHVDEARRIGWAQGGEERRLHAVGQTFGQPGHTPAGAERRPALGGFDSCVPPPGALEVEQPHRAVGKHSVVVGTRVARAEGDPRPRPGQPRRLPTAHPGGPAAERASHNSCSAPPGRGRARETGHRSPCLCSTSAQILRPVKAARRCTAEAPAGAATSAP